MLKALLKRWATMEPDRCLVVGPHDNDYRVVVGNCISLPFWHVECEGIGGGWDVFAATVEGVEARSWLWQAGRLPSGRYWARIWDRGPDGEHVDRMNCADGDPFLSEYAEPPAALLSAYLAALEAQA